MPGQSTTHAQGPKNYNTRRTKSQEENALKTIQNQTSHFVQNYPLTFARVFAIIQTERTKEAQTMTAEYWEVHEAEWEAAQEYLRNPEE